MDIKYRGHSSFIIKTKSATIVTDPYNSEIGLKSDKVDADIVTISHGHDDHNHLPSVNKPALVLDWPGEYEYHGVFVQGYPSYHDDKKGEERGKNVMYKITAEGIRIFHCGDLGHMLSDSDIESVGDVDVLILPVGGHYTLDSTGAAQLAKAIEPSIIIPMHYADEKLDEKMFGMLEPVTAFLQKMGVSEHTPVDKLVLKAEEIKANLQTKVVVMSMS